MNKPIIIALILSALCTSNAYSKTDTYIVPRTIIALYNSQIEPAHLTPLHEIAEFPLNHLGLRMEYHDIAEGNLPNLEQRSDVRGILTWFTTAETINDEVAYVTWANQQIQAGKKFVILGNMGFDYGKKGEDNQFIANKLLKNLGLFYDGQWIDLTYNTSYIYSNPELTNFERSYDKPPPSYPLLKPTKKGTSHLIIRKNNVPQWDSHLIITSPHGGLVAEGFALYKYFHNTAAIKTWYINPLAFFTKCFDTQDIPKPDTTTIAGRRIYYSHIDGDGWNNATHISTYKKASQPVLSAQVIMEKAIIPYPDLPVTVAPIAGDLDLKWQGIPQGREIAKTLFDLPHVQIGSHTYSHPFSWEFFANDPIEKERKLLHLYQGKTWGKKSLWKTLTQKIEGNKHSHYHDAKEITLDQYTVPRAYANEPFNLDKEVHGSVTMITPLVPHDKKVNIMMWSGDTTPYEKALTLTRKEGLRNINGGDSRFDTKYPSIAWLAPVGRSVNNEYQVYASNSNENTYTEFWTTQYHGFKHLLETIKNTETPLRLKPFNIYYHMYSGERAASLNALLHNLDYAHTQEITPITAYNYSGIAQGFNTLTIQKNNHTQSWHIHHRQDLQTIRFDHGLAQKVHFSTSKGVVGQRYYQNNLYIYLDEYVETPVITLQKNASHAAIPTASQAYLIDSRWKVFNVTHRKNKDFSFMAQGFGTGIMRWKVAPHQSYTMHISEKTIPLKATEDGILTIPINQTAITPLLITLVQNHV